MSRGNRLLALAVAALLVLTTTGPASADDPFEDVPDDATITIRGDGSGHGRGMSQYGAYSAARQGVKYRAILQTYYPKTRWKQARGSIEVIVVTIGWLLGGPAGWGTLAFAVLIGPSVQWAFKVFKVHPHKPEDVIVPAVAVED